MTLPVFKAPPLNRRTFLTGIASLALAIPARAYAQPMPKRVLALDWASAANILALGITPLAMPEINRYRQLMVEPAIPASVAELGLRSEPNLERIASLAPDILVINPQLAALKSRLEKVGEVVFFEPHLLDRANPHPDHIAHGKEQLAQLASQIGATPQCRDYIANFDRDLAAGKAKITQYDGRPLYIISIVDANRALVFGQNSLFQNVLDHWNIQNAWHERTSIFGHTTITLDQLTANPDARIINIGAQARMAIAIKFGIPVFTSLPAVRAGRIRLLPDTLFYGGLPCAHRFARLLADALTLQDTPS
ncbi:ABC transporter substrate-binding protein [Thalassospira marina]|uniref:Iron complex transporter substrate-binding protein n=1 Tax=Thalassospira marina TaxID=2048283 RepID=A0ABM6QBE4_9PROT|nr:ABC transporter substrate-binding protein [Thalassospira marina]AUG53884.1 iron complex transporter substrate-binding protein [Thalassospira marina]